MDNSGHRKRLRDRFLQSGLDGFLDYEIVELLLTLGTPRKDCKQPAKQAINKFHGLYGVLNTAPEDLQTIKGIGPSNIFGLKLFQSVAERYQKEQIPKKITLLSPKEVAAYLQTKFGNQSKEHFVILLLNTKNQLIDMEVVSVGTINASLVHPREVFVSAIHKLATSIILAHNHPSGDPTPSTEDVLLTKRLVEVGTVMDIHVLDHVVITGQEYYSMKEKGEM